MMKTTALVISLICAELSYAHPGTGIVADSRGNVFFTDLKHVWKVAPNGELSIAVRTVHSHELYLDSEDNLYGEHLWYDSQTGKWMTRVWCLSHAGEIKEIRRAGEGFLQDYSFVRDAQGTMYWYDAGQSCLLKRSSNGQPEQLSSEQFGDVGRMAALPDGTLYLMDRADLKRVDPNGAVTTVMANVSSRNPPPDTVGDQHDYMGVWTDADGNVFVAVAAEKSVVRIKKDGDSDVIARSPGDWSPSGGLIDREGRLWLLEYNSANQVRARRIDKEGRDRIYAT